MKLTKPKIWVLLFGLTVMFDSPGIQAQTAPTTATTTPAPAVSSTPSTPTTTPSTSAAGTMDTIVVNATPPEQNIMPTSRPVNSVLGLDMPVLDTPRNVTIISREQLDQINIQDARDYSKLTSDAYTQSDFGTPAVPSIRGLPGDVFINGMRTGWNADGNGPPVDFNNIESVNIVKGPPGAVYGASNLIGGYVDEVTKKPYFDAFQGDASATIGMYDQYRQSLDLGGPIIANQLAWRASYSGSESGSYYNYVHNDSQYGYLAVSWLPSDAYTLDFNTSFGEVDYLENNGLNRVTQDLINNGNYIQGQNLSSTNAQSGFFNTFNTTGTTKISDSNNIHNPNDGAYAKTFNTQAIQTINVNDDLKVVNNTLYQYINWRTYNGQFYDQYSDGDWSFENKTSVQLNTDIDVIDPTPAATESTKNSLSKAMKPSTDSDSGLTFNNKLNTGIDYRYQYNNDYQSIASEPFNSYDLTQDNNTIVNIQPVSTVQNQGGVYHIPGLPAKYVSDISGPTSGFNNNDTGNSQQFQTGLFAQDVLQFTPQWSLISGARADFLYVDAKTNPGSPINFEDHTTQILPNFNVSPTYKPVDWMTAYLTFNYGQAPGNTQQNGSYNPYVLQSNLFHEDNHLYEAGMKFELIKDKLYTSVTGYRQDRWVPTSDGSSFKQRVNGAEFEVNYQPDKHFYVTGSYSWFDGTDFNPGFQHQTVPLAVAANGSVLTDATTFNDLGTFKSAGYPTHSFNGLATYRFDNGLGVSFDTQVTSPINTTWVGTAVIPWQYNMDASVFYTYKKSEIKLSVYNLTDQTNFGSVNPIYGLDSIFVSEPIHVEGTVKIHF